MLQTNPDARKAALIGGLLEARQAVLAAAVGIPVEAHDEVFLGTWSLKDLLAHLVGWDYANLQAVREMLAGQMPQIYRYQDDDWQSFNQELVAQHKRDDVSELLEDVERSHRELIEFLQGLPAEEFDRHRGMRDQRFEVTITSLLEVEAREEHAHAEQLREFRERRSNLVQ